MPCAERRVEGAVDPGSNRGVAASGPPAPVCPAAGCRAAEPGVSALETVVSWSRTKKPSGLLTSFTEPADDKEAGGWGGAQRLQMCVQGEAPPQRLWTPPNGPRLRPGSSDFPQGGEGLGSPQFPAVRGLFSRQEGGQLGAPCTPGRHGATRGTHGE